MAEDSKLHATPEKKRVSWNPILEEFHSSVLDEAADESEAPHLSSNIRCSLIEQCGNVLDPSELADEDVCHESLENHSAEVCQTSERFKESIAGSMSQGDKLDLTERLSSPSLSPAVTVSQIDKLKVTVSSKDLSEAEKHAGMKRRYSMLQQSLKMPVEEERRLNRERLRNLLPVWNRRKSEV